MSGIAYAQASASSGAGGGFASFVPLILIFVIFYFLMIRPQQKRAKAHRAYLSNIKMGDKIITGEGIHGHITALDDTTATVEISDQVRVTVARHAITGSPDSANSPAVAPVGGGRLWL